MLLINLIILLPALVHSQLQSNNQESSMMHFSIQMDYIEQCKDASGMNTDGSYTLQFINPRYQRRNLDNVFFLRSKVKILEPIAGDIWFSVTMVKCKLKESPDTCEVYMLWKRDQFCQQMDQNWTDFYHILTSTGKCPLEPGLYDVNDRLDLSGFDTFPTSEGYWKFRVEMRNESGTLNCINTFFKISPLTKRQSFRMRSNTKRI